MSASLTLGFNFHFSSCDNLVGFYKSSHIIYKPGFYIPGHKYDCRQLFKDIGNDAII